MTHLWEVFNVLRENSFYVNLKKCNFLKDNFIFFGFVVSAQGIKVDESTVQAIRDVQPQSPLQTMKFPWLKTTFYMCFVRNFSTIAAPLIDCLKQKQFVWTDVAELSFVVLKERLSTAPVLAFLRR